MFEWQREPRASWVTDLRAISQPDPLLSHFELWWEPGFLWAPTQRWVVYELTPIATLSKDYAADLEQLMTLIRPCICPEAEWRNVDPDLQAQAERRERISAAIVNCPACQGRRGFGFQRIWRTYQYRKYYAQPFWIIQGSHGGHKSVYTEDEAQIAAFRGLGRTPPPAGNLPYAEWDHRVASLLVKYDVARRARVTLAAAKAEQRDELARKARAAQEAYLDAMFEQIRHETPVTILDEIPRVHGFKQVDEHEAQARYIETGQP